jgi:hypothetical protein
MSIIFYQNVTVVLEGYVWMDMNSRIVIVLGIEITVVYLNTNLLFRNSENNCYSTILC